jgi:RNA polymerase sigma factor (sigma-70 family)
MAEVQGDHELLGRFRADGSAPAFAELVDRHVGWVYRSSRRQVRDPALADDVTQAVFILLARRPPTLRPGTPLSPWLFRATRNIALTAIRSEARRRRHERRAATMATEASDLSEPAEWRSMAPHLDGLIQSLRASDRELIVLRYLERRSLADLGRLYKTSEDACRKKVARALDRLRAAAVRRGLATPAAPALGAAFLAETPAAGLATKLAPSTVASKALLAAKGGAGGAASVGLAGVLADGAVQALRRSAIISRALAAVLCVALLGGVWVSAAGLLRRDAEKPKATASAAPPSLPTKTPGKLRVGYLVSKYTVDGPGRAFNGSKYTHAHSKVVPLLTDPTTELWAVVEPGTDDDPGIAQIVQTVFDGRQLDGGDVAQLKTCDVLVAAGVRNAVGPVLGAIDHAVSDAGVGLLVWIPIGETTPGTSEPLVRRLNGLADTARGHYSKFSLDWLDTEVVNAHPLLGGVRAGAKAGPRPFQFRPEVLAPLDASATPLVRFVPEWPKEQPAFYPVYVTSLGRGRIVHFGFATYTQIPWEFDRAVGGRFTMRCLYWLAGRSPAAVPALTATTKPTSKAVNARPLATNR